MTRREEGLLERKRRMLRWILGVSLKDKKIRSSERRWGGMHYWQNTRGQIAMVWLCD